MSPSFNKRSQAKSQLGRSNLCKKDESLNSNNNSLAKVILEGKPKNKHQDEDNWNEEENQFSFLGKDFFSNSIITPQYKSKFLNCKREMQTLSWMQPYDSSKLSLENKESKVFELKPLKRKLCKLIKQVKQKQEDICMIL